MVDEKEHNDKKLLRRIYPFKRIENVEEYMQIIKECFSKMDKAKAREEFFFETLPRLCWVILLTLLTVVMLICFAMWLFSIFL